MERPGQIYYFEEYMTPIPHIQKILLSGQADAALKTLYGGHADRLRDEKQRYANLLDKFKAAFPRSEEAEFFSSPGRTEIGGNHTDHNAGRVLAAAVDLDILAVVARRQDNRIEVVSEGYPPINLQLDGLKPLKNERFTTTALIRGVGVRMQELGYAVGGFEAVITSRVPKGSGLSSSAAYEVLIATILDHLYNRDRLDPVLKAQICQYAENNFFGKPCGLMDQTTCAVGGFVTIDFKYFDRPLVKKVDFDFSDKGYTLVIVDTGGSHADLNEDYAAIKNEMQSVAQALGGKWLRDFSLEQVLQAFPRLRGKVSDRALLRAMHFYMDDQRVVEQVQALEANDMHHFLQLVNESGASSWKLLQNCYTPADIQEQGITLGLALSQVLLQGSHGAYRVHGGGFAGTIQVFVPEARLAHYLAEVRAVFGKHACQALQIRSLGATVVNF
jgi:galactokinase